MRSCSLTAVVSEIHPAIRNLRDHIGTHPQNLDHMSKAREWEGLFKEAHRMITERLRREDTEKLLVLVFCRAGRPSICGYGTRALQQPSG